MQLIDVNMSNFRCYTNKTITLEDKTVIRAKNGFGKSTIAEAVIWCLYGTDIRGKKNANSRLIQRGQTEMSVTTNWASSKGDPFSISRVKPETGSVKVMVNGRKAKPGEIEGLFGEKVDDFLSIFIPGHFSSLEPEKAKVTLANAIPDVSMDEVFKLIPAETRELLQNEQFALGIDSAELLAKNVRGEIAEIQKEILRLEGQKQAYEEVSAKGELLPPKSKLTSKSHENYNQSKNIKKSIEARRSEMEKQLYLLTAKRDAMRTSLKHVLGTLKMASCPTCGQEISKHRAGELKDHQESVVEEGKKLSSQIEAIQAELQNTELLDRVNDYIAEFEAIAAKEQVEYDMYAADTRMAKEAKEKMIEIEKDIASLNHELFKLQEKLKAVQSLKLAYVRYQHKKLNSHFSDVQIILTKVDQETGELKSDFKISWRKRPYNTLSRSERVRCDVEIGRVLAMPKGESMPVFIDDAEGVQDVFDQQFGGQVIAAYVFDSGELLVDSLENTKASLEDELQNMIGLLGGKASGF